MDILKRSDVEQLAQAGDGICVSLYLTTHRFGEERQQDPIRYKNLLQKVKNRLEEAHMSPPQVEKFLEPAWGYTNHMPFWEQQSDGLAVFLDDNGLILYRLPADFKDFHAVGPRFHIKPLLPLVSGAGEFFLLALDLEGSKLYHGNKSVFELVDLGDTPTGIEEALWMDDPEKHMQFHTKLSLRTGGGEGRRAQFHGQGGFESDIKTDIRRFFQRLEKGVQDQISGRTAPMILGGLDYLIPIYREVNNYPYIVDKAITKDIHNHQENQLHKWGWEIAAPLFTKEKEEKLKKFHFQKGNNPDLVSTNLGEIVSAAYFKRVDALLLREGKQHFGIFDPQDNETRAGDERSLENYDVLDFAAAHTILNKGDVYILEEDEMPVEEDAAAILRF